MREYIAFRKDEARKFGLEIAIVLEELRYMSLHDNQKSKVFNNIKHIYLSQQLLDTCFDGIPGNRVQGILYKLYIFDMISMKERNYYAVII